MILNLLPLHFEGVSGGFEVQPPCTLAEAIASEARPSAIPRQGSSADITNEEEQAVRELLIVCHIVIFHFRGLDCQIHFLTTFISLRRRVILKLKKIGFFFFFTE